MRSATAQNLDPILAASARRIGLGGPLVQRLAADRMLVDAFLEAVEGGFDQLARAIAVHG